MKKYYLIFIVGIVFYIYGCEKTEISLNTAGDLAEFKGTWVTAKYIDKTYYLANPQTAAQILSGDITYRDTTVVDSTNLTFTFGAVRADSVQVTAVKTVNKLPQAPVNLLNTRWSFTTGTSTGAEKSGSTYFIVFQTDYPHNPINGYGLTYTYKMITPAQMEISWYIHNSNIVGSSRNKAILNKQ